MNIAKKNVVFVGGFGGIGQQCVRKFLEMGVSNIFVLEWRNNEDLIEEWQKSFPIANIEYIEADMSQFASIERAYKLVMEKVDHLDLVVNASAVLNEKEVDLMLAVNLNGVIHSSLIAFNYMRKDHKGRGGKIVNISSISALNPMSVTAVYSAAKSGVNGFTLAMGHPIYHEKTGVTFISICPGKTITSMCMPDHMRPKSTLPEFYDLLRQSYMNIPSQTVEQFVNNFMEVLKVDENGSMWKLEGGSLEMIAFNRRM
ncbi:fat body protein 2-like [Haematobia irritans]|uniref:fat body protein 2-like n=1 Tax=Haematobia irritans TaxID=7368 RepID=UPI003F504571